MSSRKRIAVCQHILPPAYAKPGRVALDAAGHRALDRDNAVDLLGKGF